MTPGLPVVIPVRAHAEDSARAVAAAEACSAICWANVASAARTAAALAMADGVRLNTCCGGAKNVTFPCSLRRVQLERPRRWRDTLDFQRRRYSFGDDLIGGDPGSGFRVNGGTWLNSEKSVGVGGRFFYVTNEEDYSITSSAGGEPILARPFFNTTTASADALLVAFPAISHGSININAENEARGFDVYFRKLLLSGYCNRLDVIGGFQNTSVTDSVDVFNSLISDDATRIPLGAQIDTRDLFEVENEFNGGFVGLMGSAEDGRLSWNFLAKVAFGNMNQEATISGTTTSSVPGVGSATNDVGLLALPTNIGTFDQDEFAVVPELAVSVGYDFTDNFSLTLGYSFIYWSEVALAGDMIDTTLNTSQLTGPLVGDARPAASLSSDGFFYTGLTVGGALRF